MHDSIVMRAFHEPTPVAAGVPPGGTGRQLPTIEPRRIPRHQAMPIAISGRQDAAALEFGHFRRGLDPALSARSNAGPSPAPQMSKLQSAATDRKRGRFNPCCGWSAPFSFDMTFARAHGMRTDEPRQGRKAATVVCSACAVVTLAFLMNEARIEWNDNIRMTRAGKPVRRAELLEAHSSGESRRSGARGARPSDAHCEKCRLLNPIKS